MYDGWQTLNPIIRPYKLPLAPETQKEGLRPQGMATGKTKALTLMMVAR